MRWPLRYQILIPFALVLVTAILAVSVLTAVLAAHRAQRQIEEQLQSIAGTLAQSDFPLRENVLRQMHGLSGADFVFTDDAGHTTAASTHLDLPGADQTAANTDWKQLRLGPPVEIGGQRFFHMALLLDRRGQRDPGRLHILYPEGFWQEARSEAVVPPLVVGGIALAITVLIALLIAGRLTRPIIELRSQVSRIAQADYQPMPLPTRNDELHDLAADVNRLAEQLAEMERAIRRGERLALLGQLSGGLAHHLRNNITGALIAVQLHARQCAVDRESLEVALRQLSLTEENLKQFLAAPQAALQSTQSPNFTACRLCDVVHEVVQLLGPSLQHRRVHLTVQQDSIGNLDLQADRNQLRQLLMNLVLNAADAAGPGGWIKIEVEEKSVNATVSGTKPRLVLRVIDNGPGPPREMLQRLFEPLATSKPEGIGLGLAVAQQIAQSHGGQVVFLRENNETCFEVHLNKAESRRQIAQGKEVSSAG